MKHLSDYMEEKQTKLFTKHKVFFAFSPDQMTQGLEKTGQEVTDIVHMGGGMYAQKSTADALVDDLERLVTMCIAHDVKENGIDAVIARELANHEAYYTGDIDSTCEALELYPTTREYILERFYIEQKRESKEEEWQTQEQHVY